VFDPQGMGHARKILTDVEFCHSALEACSGADCAVITTEWQEFCALDARTLARAMRRQRIVDLRNLLDREKFVREGFVVHSVGRPTRLPDRAAPGLRDGGSALASADWEDVSLAFSSNVESGDVVARGRAFSSGAYGAAP